MESATFDGVHLWVGGKRRSLPLLTGGTVKAWNPLESAYKAREEKVSEEKRKGI
jgi:hypothetical protein